MSEIIEQDFEEFKVGEPSPYNKNITYLGCTSEKGPYRRFFVKCSTCASDPELYGEGVFCISIRPLRTGKSCYCFTGGLKPTSDMYSIKVKRLCKELNYKFLGFEGDSLKSSTKLHLMCDKGHEYKSTSVSKFLSCGRRCPLCAGNSRRNYTPDKVLSLLRERRGNKYEYKDLHKVTNNRDKFIAVCPKHGDFKTDLYHHTIRKQDCPHPECCFKKISEVRASTTQDFINKSRDVHGDKYDYSMTEYERCFKDVRIGCKACGNIFTQVANDHLQGNGCNLCNLHQKQLYIFLIKDNGIPVSFKVGSAVDYKKRLRRQSLESCFDIEPLFIWYTQHQYTTRLAENHIKTDFKGSFLSKREYSDGYSETFNLQCLDAVIKILDGYGVREFL